MFKEIKFFNNFSILQKIKQLIFLIFLCSFVINFLTIIVSFYSMQIFDKVLNSSSLETLFYLTFLTIILIFFINLFCNFRNDLMQKINVIIQKRVINNFKEIQDVNKKFNITQNLQKINSFFNNNFSSSIFEIIFSFFYIIAIYLIHPSLAVYGIIALLLIIIFDNFHQKNISYLQQNLHKNHEQNSQIFLTINRINNPSKFYGIIQNIFQKWQDGYKIFLNLEINYFKTHNKYLVLNKNLRLLLQILATMICAYLVIKNQISAGSIIAVSILLSKFLEPFGNFSNNLKNFQEFLINFKKIYYEKDAENYEKNHDLFSLKSFNKITFNKVFYRHQDNKNFIIQTENFSIYPRKIIAILAKSEIERDAIYNLLVQNYCPAFGSIEIDDFDLQKIPRDQLLNCIDLIESEPILFEGNLLENIAKMTNNFSQEKIINFVKNFTFDCGISSLKNNFFSNCEALNSDQKYWICALRALYNSPKILFIEKFYFNQEFQNFFDYLSDYKNSQNSVIFINNPPVEFLKKIDAVIVFKNGMANFFNTKDFIKSNEKTSKLLI
jgi:ABC-type protease/lipase transport system fused ATPase/permease subunit